MLLLFYAYWQFKPGKYDKFKKLIVSEVSDSVK